MNPIDGSPVDHEYRYDMDSQVECPQCGAWQDESDCFLGQLGHLTHYRCRFCGITFNQRGGVQA